jgi:hypothetical protein
MLLEQAACVFFDDGVELLVCAGEDVERVQGCRTPVLGERIVIENFNEDFEWERVEFRDHG